jgi:hypothetical protein
LGVARPPSPFDIDMTLAIAKLFALFLIATAAPVAAQDDVRTAATKMPGRVLVPFAPGERLVYDVHFGAFRVGSGRMEVAGIETLRGREAWHTIFSARGGTFFYRVNDRYESWFDTRTFASLRHIQDIDEGKYEKERTFEIYPERGVFQQIGFEEQPTVTDPLDDGSLLYFIRTVPFSVGQTYEFNRYFRPDRNPVTVHVVRKERINVPAGTFNTIVIRPVIKTTGIFGEGGHAEIWLSDDPRRIIVQMKSQLKFGSLNLYLKSYQPGETPSAASP